MKLFTKTIKYTGVSLGLIILLLILLAEFAEAPVSKLALKNIQKSFGASIKIENIDFSLIKDFPNAQLDLKNVTIKGDPVGQADIMTLQHAYLSVKILPLLDNKIEIVRLELENGQANYHVAQNGTSNLDCFLSGTPESEPDTCQTAMLILAPTINTNNLTVNYTDETQKIKATLTLNEISLKLTQDNHSISAGAYGNILINKLHYPNSKVHLMKQTSLDINILYTKGTITLNPVQIISDEANITIAGKIGINNNYPANISIAESTLNLKELSKYIPDSILSCYKLSDIDGTLGISANIEGNLNDSVLPAISADMHLENASCKVLNYPHVTQFNAQLFYSNGTQHCLGSSTIDIKQLELTTPKSIIKLNARVANVSKPAYSFETNLTLDLAELKAFIPDDTHIGMEGSIKGSFNNKGTLPDSIDTSYFDELLKNSVAKITFANMCITMDSTLNIKDLNGIANYSPGQFELDSLSCRLPEYNLMLKPSLIRGSYNGRISNPSELTLNLDSFNIVANNSLLAGNAFVKNGQQVEYNINSTATVNLEDWGYFIPDTLITEHRGEIMADISSEGTLNPDSLYDEAMKLLFKNSQLNLLSNNLSLSTPDSLINIQSLNGAIYLGNDSIALNSISGNFNQTDFSIDSSSICKLYNSILLNNKDTIRVQGFAHLGSLDYDMIEKLIPKDDPNNKTDLTDTSKYAPSNYAFEVKGKFGIDRIKYKQAVFENISGLYKLTDSLYIVDQLKIDGFKGCTNSSVKVQLLPNKVKKIYFKNQIHGIDINQLLIDFEDFKQFTNKIYISHVQLSGFISTDNLNGEITYINDSLDMNTIKLTTDIILENGRLHNYPMTKEMGEDYNIDNLEDLHFKTIDTKLFVYKGAVYAPLTNIKSNTFDISLFGMQNFNMDCQYHLRFYLKEILRKGKTDRIERKQANKDKRKDDGGTKGLSSLFAIYKVVDGKTVKSTLEGKDSKERGKMERSIKNKEAIYEFYFNPKLVKYNTSIKN